MPLSSPIILDLITWYIRRYKEEVNSQNIVHSIAFTNVSIYRLLPAILLGQHAVASNTEEAGAMGDGRGYTGRGKTGEGRHFDRLIRTGNGHGKQKSTIY